MEIEELDLAATTTIELNTAPGGRGLPTVWQKLDDLSTRAEGHGCTAIAAA